MQKMLQRGQALAYYLLKRSSHIFTAQLWLFSPSRSVIHHTGVRRLIEHHSGLWTVSGGPSPYRSFCHSNQFHDKSNANKRQRNEAAKPAVSGDEICQIFDASEKLIGQVTVKEAERIAKRDSLKLFEMGRNADGLRSFKLVSGKELAEESVRLRTEEKSKKLKEKEFRIVSNITDHDLEVKIKQARDAVVRGVYIKFVIKPHKKQSEDAGERQTSVVTKKIMAALEDSGQIKYGIRTPQEVQLLLRPMPNTLEVH